MHVIQKVEVNSVGHSSRKALTYQKPVSSSAEAISRAIAERVYKRVKIVHIRLSLQNPCLFLSNGSKETGFLELFRRVPSIPYHMRLMEIPRLADKKVETVIETRFDWFYTRSIEISFG